MNQITLGKMIDSAQILCDGTDPDRDYVQGLADLIMAVCDIAPEHEDSIIHMILV